MSELSKKTDIKNISKQTIDLNQKIKITFDNGRIASAWKVSANVTSTQILSHLDLNADNMPKALILIAGSATQLDDDVTAHLIQLFSRGIAKTAADIGADIIDGGTSAIAIMGHGVADRDHQSRLFGIAPIGRVTYPSQADYQPTMSANEADKLPLEPNHCHFLLVDVDEWGQEIDAMYALATGLATKIPVISILVNGGSMASQQILRSVRHNWPIIIVSGSGRLADRITELMQNKSEFIADPYLSEIIDDGRLFFFPINGSIAELDRLIRQQLRGNTTLRLAWQRFAIYDLNANIHQKTFRTIQFRILFLGVLGTFFALIQSSLAEMLLLTDIDLVKHIETFGKSAIADFIYKLMLKFVRDFKVFFQGVVDGLRYVIILIPITITMLVAAANRFNSGSKWLVLRGTAEAIKQEIFRYRARAEIYSPDQCGGSKKTREVKLAEKLQALNTQAMKTEVSQSALRVYDKPLPPQWSIAPNDDGFTQISPEQYLTHRLEDQLDYYIQKTNKLDDKLGKIQWLIYIIGSIGTLLAALGLELWIAFTGALVTAFGSYLEYQKIEESLLKYNQAATDLSNVRSWWVSLSPIDQEKQHNIDYLVGQSERILHNEFSGWAAEMQTAMDELKEDNKAKTSSKQNKIDLSEGKVPPKINKTEFITLLPEKAESNSYKKSYFS